MKRVPRDAEVLTLHRTAGGMTLNGRPRCGGGGCSEVMVQTNKHFIYFCKACKRFWRLTY